uniref:Uncharacterized protein n=1 Tax=Rhizophora mucronata TaxID=61149 RepID=A0A2P2PR83_RHIMU
MGKIYSLKDMLFSVQA